MPVSTGAGIFICVMATVYHACAKQASSAAAQLSSGILPLNYRNTVAVFLFLYISASMAFIFCK
jgi:hypothetical protein